MAIEANLLGSNTASLPKDFLFTAVRLVDLLVVTCLFTVLWAIYIYIRYRRVVQALNYLTGTHTLLSKPSLTAFLLSEIPFINTKDIWPWHYNWASPYTVVDTHVSLIVTLPVFQRYGQDIISLYTILPEPEALVCIAHPRVIKVCIEYLLPSPSTPKPCSLPPNRTSETIAPVSRNPASYTTQYLLLDQTF